jgi:tRNA pseudouridine32 synthase/23S rRNA pseudouridine746 synthase
MLLHASRLVVPREGKPTIDVTAPLPDYFGEWRSFDKLRTENAA